MRCRSRCDCRAGASEAKPRIKCTLVQFNMKMVSLESIIACLENESPEIIMDEDTRKSAERSILNMIAIK